MARLDLEQKQPEPSTNVGPFSSLFDWNKEETDLLARKEKLQATQQKIMRVNALGEAFRILSESVAASKGATISPRNVNPGILKATQEYSKADMDYINKLQNLKTTKLALAGKDIQYKQAAELQKGKLESQSQAAQAKQLNDYIAKLQIKENDWRLKGEEDKANAAQREREIILKAQASVDEYQQKTNIDRGLSPGQSARGIKLSNEDLALQEPESNSPIYMRPDEVNAAAFILSNDVNFNKFEPKVSSAIKDVLKGDKPDPIGLAVAFQQNWDKIKIVMPEFRGKVTTTPVQTQPQGLPPATTTAIMKGITIILNTDKTNTGKVKDIAKLIQTTYRNSGLTITDEEAQAEAKEQVDDWKKQNNKK